MNNCSVTNYKNNTVFFFCTLLTAFLPILFKVFGLHKGFSSILCTALTTFILIFCYCVNSKTLLTKKFVFLVLLNAISLALSVGLNGGVGVMLVYVNMILMLHMFNNVYFTKKQCQIIHLFMSAYLIYWVFSLDISLVWKSFVYEPNMNYINPCTMAIITLIAYYHFLIFCNLTFKRKWVRFSIYFALTAFALYFIDQAVCRASLMSLFAFFVFLLIKEKLIANYKKILFTVLLCSFLFPVLYIALYYTIDGINFFGKNLFTGRQVVWSSTYKNIFENVFLGAGSGNTIQLRNTLMDDAHNFFLGIWKNLGFVPVVSIWLLLLSGKSVSEIYGVNKLAKIMFLTSIIASTVETVLNGSEYYIFYLTLLITVNDETTEMIQNTNKINSIQTGNLEEIQNDT